MNREEHFIDTPERKRSRKAYCGECTFEYLVSLLVADAFLAKILTELGFDDASIGIISSFISLAFLFQLLSVFTVQKIRNVKKFSIPFHSISQLFFMSLYLLPFLPFAAKYRRALAVVCILLAYFGNYLVLSIIFRWGNSNVDPQKRASYTALKECVSLVCGMAVSLVIGAVMDRFEENGNPRGGFLFAAIAIFVFCVCDFICLLLIKNQDEPPRASSPSVDLRIMLQETLGNKKFRRILYIEAVWKFGIYLTFGFLATYKLMMYTVVQVQLINILGNLGRIVFSRFFGKFSDRFSFAKGFELAAVVTLVSFACSMLATPKTCLLMLFHIVLYNIAQAGIVGNMQNITYSYVPSDYFAQASAIKNCIGGLCGFGAALLGSKILSIVQGNGDQLFGLAVYGQQVLSALTCLILLAVLLYTHFFVNRQSTPGQ